jgi:(1->4)-alpha-D-glucan 1-alpha-D-glucosylmutase
MTDHEAGAYLDRIEAYTTKAVREAKVHTSWINPNQAYESAVSQFIRRLLDRAKPNAFLDDFHDFARTVAQLGIVNSLSQLLIKIVAPGIPDFYQGTERWDLSLVDPDNRHPVDFETRSRLLAALLEPRGPTDHRALVDELLRTRADGRIKLFVTTTALRYRREHAALFLEGSYQPLPGVGDRARHLLAFARSHQGRTVVAVVPRLIAGLLPDSDALPVGAAIWGNTRIEPPSDHQASSYRNVLTGELVRPVLVEGRPMCAMADLLATFPVALLETGP